MNVVVWIVSGLLAAAFLMSGSMKLAKSKEQHVADPRIAWAEDISPGPRVSPAWIRRPR